MSIPTRRYYRGPRLVVVASLFSVAGGVVGFAVASPLRVQALFPPTDFLVDPAVAGRRSNPVVDEPPGGGLILNVLGFVNVLGFGAFRWLGNACGNGNLRGSGNVRKNGDAPGCGNSRGLLAFIGHGSTGRAYGGPDRGVVIEAPAASAARFGNGANNTTGTRVIKPAKPVRAVDDRDPVGNQNRLTGNTPEQRRRSLARTGPGRRAASSGPDGRRTVGRMRRRSAAQLLPLRGSAIGGEAG